MKQDSDPGTHADKQVTLIEVPKSLQIGPNRYRQWESEVTTGRQMLRRKERKVSASLGSYRFHTVHHDRHRSKTGVLTTA